MDENTLPPGAVAGRNGFGERGWGGPRPPVGDQPHRYFFRLYAVDRPLDLDDATTGAELRSVLDKRAVTTGTLVGLFGR